MQRNFSGAFTLIELLIVITIIIILASIAYPVYTNVQERARATQDLNNLRQIGLATQMYLNDNDGAFFDATGVWMAQLQPKYLPGWKIFQSPFDQGPTRTPSEVAAQAPISYGFNENAHGTSATDLLSSDKILNASEFILFAPAQPFTKRGTDAPVNVSKDNAGPRGPTKGGTHSGGQRINACMADLHVESISWKDFHSDDPDAGTTYSKSSRWHPDPR